MTGKRPFQSIRVHTVQEMGQALARARRRKKLRQADAARSVAVSQRLWCEMETGKRRNVGTATLLKMLTDVGVQVYLVYES